LRTHEECTQTPAPGPNCQSDNTGQDGDGLASFWFKGIQVALALVWISCGGEVRISKQDSDIKGTFFYVISFGMC
ncbi:hypothetical protein SCA6_019835, partial [Theobroma cacao]